MRKMLMAAGLLIVATCNLQSQTTSPARCPIEAHAGSLLQIMNSPDERVQSIMTTQGIINGEPKKTAAAIYATSLSSDDLLEEVPRILSAEKFSLQSISDGTIWATGKPFSRPNSCAAVFIAIQNSDQETCLATTFVTYPGCIFDKSPSKFLAIFENALKKAFPEIKRMQ